VGFVTTYSSLVQDPAIFIDWAERNRGRFLLIADEAQFCGSTNDDRSGGTRAGGYIQRLHEYSAHTLLLTGTPYRSDGQPLILAKYDQVDEVGRRRLLSDVEATYRDGVTEGYLRPFEATLHDARVRWRAVTNDVHEYDLSNNGTDLREVLRNPEVYQPIVDQVVKLVGRKQRINESYRGLISCMEQADARKVHDYLRREHPSIQTRIAVSDDGADAEEALRQFGMETKVADILVTVRKAFIGYDCPQITVVGVLTNYRDPGHLMQLVGRGLRMWTGTGGQPQSCLVVAPDDPEMQAFIDFMRDESNAGMKEREQHQQGDGDHSPKTPEKLGGVESAHATTHRAIGPDAEVAHKELVYIEALMTEYGMVGDATKLAQLLAREQVGWLKAHSERPATLPAEVTSDPLINEEPALTESEQIQEVGRRTRSAINKYLNSAGFSPKAPDYGRLVARMTDAVNREAGVSSKEVWTMVEASRRLDAVATLAHQGWLPS
jgi:superfamily II DNA or RNA helicase